MTTLRSGGMWWRALFVVAAIAAAAAVAAWTDSSDGASSDDGARVTGTNVVFVQDGDGRELPLERIGPTEPCLRIEDHVAGPIPTTVPDEGILVPDGTGPPVCLAEHG